MEPVFLAVYRPELAFLETDYSESISGWLVSILQL